MSEGRLDGLSKDEKREMLQAILGRPGPGGVPGSSVLGPGSDAGAPAAIPEQFYRFDRFPAYEQLMAQRFIAERAGIPSPFFQTHEGVARDTTMVEGRTLINFGTYNYLDLNGDPRVTRAALDAAERWGTSASASRVVSGERPIQGRLEARIASLLNTEAAVVFVSGHATNVAVIGHLLGPRDLVVHDELIHNSVLMGVRLSGADRKVLSHNDVGELDRWLDKNRGRYEKVLVAVEGLYSMDGDVPPLPALVRLREKHRFLLMVDEAHSIGVVGERGRGVREHFGLEGRHVDLWMGTLSKSFAGQGGYIAGTRALVEYLKATCPGFVYSVGISPPLAAASLEAIRIMEAEPERVSTLRGNGLHFLRRIQEAGLDPGLSEGYAVVPVIIGNSLEAIMASNALFQAGVSVQPIIHPAVPERSARLRFFISSAHSHEQLDRTVERVAEVVAGVGPKERR